LECIIVLLLCWITAILGPLSFLLPLLLIYGITRLLLTRALLMLSILLIANPFCLGLVIGVSSYLKGQPYLLGMGLPGTEHANIDPATRCFRATGGCVIRGNEWVFQLPHNFAVRTMAMTMGPPSGSYDGPYPTREEASKAVADGEPVRTADFATGRVELPTGTIQLDSTIAEQILEHCIPNFWYSELLDEEDEQSHGRLTATLWQDRCLILRWQGKLLMDEGSGEVVVLIDIETSRPFAIYELTPGAVRGRAVIGRFWR